MRIGVAAALGFCRGDAGRYEYCAARRLHAVRPDVIFPSVKISSQKADSSASSSAQLMREMNSGARSGATRRSVVGADAGSRSTELIADIVTFVRPRQRSYEREDIQGKLLRACL